MTIKNKGTMARKTGKMATEQENKTIEQELDDEARSAAIDNELEFYVQRVVYYENYYLGALRAVQKVFCGLTTKKPNGDDWVCLRALLRFITKSKRNMHMFLDGKEIRYRNHQRDKRGRLKGVECYFAEKTDTKNRKECKTRKLKKSNEYDKQSMCGQQQLSLW